MANQIKVYMATQQNKTVGVRIDYSTKMANRFDVKGTTPITRMSALEALVAELEATVFEGMEAPMQIFMNGHMINNINNGYYKFWLLTSCTHDGEVISEKELELWERFNNVYSANNVYIILKSTSDTKIKDYLKEMEGKKAKGSGKIIKITMEAKQNEKYSSFCWDKVKELVGSIDDNDIDDSKLA